MSNAPVPNTHSHRETRKALVALRMEMHRQEIRKEAGQIVNPLTRLKGMGKGVSHGMGIKHASLWGMAGVTLLGFITGKRVGNGPAPAPLMAPQPVVRQGRVGQVIKLTTTLLPLIRMALRGNSQRF
jgi:hypothetical protein